MVKSNLMALLCLTSLPSFAQDTEVTIAATKQSTRNFMYSTNTDDIRYEVEHPTAMNLRFGWVFAKVEQTDFLVLATYNSQSSASMHVILDNNPAVSGSTYLKLNDDLKNQGVSFGVRVNQHRLIDYGLGLEARFERLSQFGTHEDSIRPWVSAHLGIAIPNGKATNLIGFETAYALSKVTSDPNSAFTLKTFAPTHEFGLYMGVRF